MSRDELRLRDLVLAALLTGMGLVLHAIFPGILGGMKPDFALLMLFVVIMVIPDRRIALITGIATGILTALTTTFPMGQVPNLIDKAVTTGFVLGITVLAPRNIPVLVKVLLVGVLGTVVSGTAFLTSALLLTGLPAPFPALFAAVVLPATVINTLGLAVFYPVVHKLYELQERRIPGELKKARN